MANKKPNNNTNGKTIVKVVMKSSDECEKCPNKCVAGKSYLQRMTQPGYVGHGVACK